MGLEGTFTSLSDLSPVSADLHEQRGSQHDSSSGRRSPTT